MAGSARSSVRVTRSTKARKRTRPRWTKQEVEVLRRLYRTHSNADIAAVLGRKVSSVVFKAHRLGLAKGIRRLREMGRENISLRWHAQRASKKRKSRR